jgi:hypothetical protein
MKTIATGSTGSVLLHIGDVPAWIRGKSPVKCESEFRQHIDF